MIAEQRILTTTERRRLERDHALGEVISLTTGGLSPRGEREVRAAVMRQVDLILDLADSATVALLELEAVERRLDAHAYQCRACVPLKLCAAYRVLQVRQRRLLASWDRAHAALLRGGR